MAICIKSSLVSQGYKSIILTEPKSFAINETFLTQIACFRIFSLSGAYLTKIPYVRDYPPKQNIFDLNTPILRFSHEVECFRLDHHSFGISP